MPLCGGTDERDAPGLGLRRRATADTAATPERVAAAMLHVAGPVGEQAASILIRIVKQTCAPLAAQAAEALKRAETATAAGPAGGTEGIHV